MAAQKKSGLGRGLESVFTENANVTNNTPPTLRLSQIQPRKAQPRKTFDEEGLAELAASIAEHGLIQPITVRPTASGIYEIVAGERRWRAARMAGIQEVPVMVMDVDDRKTSVLALIENIQRENLNPIELAGSFRALIEEYGLTQEELSETLGKSRSGIANYLRLLELPPKTTVALAKGEITTGHAKVLAGLGQDADLLVDTVKEKELSVRQTEELVKRFNKPVKEEKHDEEENVIKIDYASVLADRIRKNLGRQVAITKKGKKNKLELYYEDEKDLEELICKLCGDDFFNE
ncbi:MAG: ParB/RepB/Spo0J family partition protein [Clostridia bacterium]|nr:ParB/RepB/Spo0J family partition protein [Clostridia bacterium]